MAAATNDLNKIIKDTAIQLPQCMQMIDSIVKVIGNLGKYDIKKMRANIANFKKIMHVVEDYHEAINEIMGSFGQSKSTWKNKISKMTQIILQKNPTDVTGQETTPYNSGFELFDQTANVIITLRKLVDGMMDLSEGKKGKFMRKTRTLKKLKKRIIKVIDVISDIIEGTAEKIKSMGPKLKDFGKQAKQFDEVFAFFDKLGKLIKKILLLSLVIWIAVIVGPIFLMGLAAFSLIITGIFMVLKLVRPMKIRRAYSGIRRLAKLFMWLGLLILEMVLLAMVMPQAVKAAAIIALGMLALGLLLIFIMMEIWILNKAIRIFKIHKCIIIVVKVIIMINIMMVFILTLAILLLGISKVVTHIELGPLILYLAALAVIIYAFARMGKAATKSLPAIVPAVKALVIIVGALTIIIALIFIMSLMLWALQFINLDEDKIKKNVQKVVATALLVIKSIFEPQEKTEDDKGKPWYKKFLCAILDGIAFIIEAIIAVVFLALTLVAISIILLIAVNLRLLQEINLDEALIVKNVKFVIDTALMVVNLTLYGQEKKPEDDKGKAWYQQLFEFVGGRLVQIIEVIFAIIFLALSLIAITLVLLIAGELRLLQTISMDDKLIAKNVKLVIDTALMVVNLTLYGQEKKPEDDKGKPWYKKLFEFIGGRLIQIIEVIFAVIFLALSLIAITLVLLIAGELRLLQTISLDEKLIAKNVKIVIDTADLVVDSIFSPDNREEDPTKKSTFRKIIEVLGFDKILKIIDAILAVAYLALIVVAILLVKFIADTLHYIQSLSLDDALIKNNVKIVIDTANLVVGSIFSPDNQEENHSSKSFIRRIFEFLGLDKIVAFIEAIMSIAYLALVLVSIHLVKHIAETLEYIQNLNLDAESVKNNTKKVIDCAKVVISAVFQKDNTQTQEAGGIFKRILKWILPDSWVDLVEILSQIGFLAVVKSSVGLIAEIARDLTTINNLPKLDGIKDKVGLIIDTSKHVIDRVLFGQKNLGELEDAADEAEDALDDIVEVPELLAEIITEFNKLPQVNTAAETKANTIIAFMIKTINTINGIGSKKIEDCEDNAETILDIIEEIVDDVNDININQAKAAVITGVLNSFTNFGTNLQKMNINPKVINEMKRGLGVITGYASFVAKNKSVKDSLSTTERFLNAYNKFFQTISSAGLTEQKEVTMTNIFKSISGFTQSVTNDDISKSATLLRNYDQFLTKVNSLQLNNLETATKLFKEMAEFSNSINGDFQGLADTLNERIAPLLEELKNLIESVNTNVKTVKTITQEISAPSREMKSSAEAEIRSELKIGAEKELTPEQKQMVTARAKEKEETKNGLKDIKALVEKIKTTVVDGTVKVRS